MNSSDLAYKKILEERIKSIDSEIEKLRKRDDSLLAFHTQIENRISGLKIEREKINEEIKNYTGRDTLGDKRENMINAMGDRYNAKNEKQQDIQTKIDELKTIKSTIQGNHANKVIGRRIKRLEDKVNNLKSKKIRLINIQRKIMYPKYRYLLKKQRKISLQEGKINNYQTKINDLDGLRNSLNKKSIVSPITNKIYDIKKTKYQRKVDRTNKIINKIQNREGKAHISSARKINIKSKVADRLRKIADRLSPSISTTAPVR